MLGACLRNRCAITAYHDAVRTVSGTSASHGSRQLTHASLVLCCCAENTRDAVGSGVSRRIPGSTEATQHPEDQPRSRATGNGRV